MFLRDFWYVAGWSHQIQPGEIAARTIVGVPIILWRTNDQKLAVLEDRCCHRFAPLSRGRLEGGDIRCMYHGLKFTAAGTCIEIPSTDQIPAGLRVRTFPVIEQDRWVWVWMGDPARADASLIPRALGHEDSDYRLATGELHYDANYQLIHDNLLDLTHLAFVHEKTLGRGATGWATSQPAFKPLEHGVRVARWIPDARPASYAPMQAGAKVDQWSAYDFVLPGIFLLRSSGYPVGTSERYPEGPGDRAPIYSTVTSQAVTPITENSTIYYFSGGQPARQASEEVVEAQLKLFGVAFNEDKVIIEAQQKIIDRSPGKTMMTLSFDRSIAQFRRLLAARIEDQTKRNGQ